VEELVRKAEEKGINVEDLIISAIAKKDPQEGLRIRLELAEKYMNEMEDYLKKGDAVQASEKAYKVAEEIVKALAEKFNTSEYQQFIKEGRWHTYLLGKASNTLASKVGDWILNGWSNAHFLHGWGFHEAKLSVNDMTSYINKVREMFEEAKKLLS
jgi:hypothetical protein